MSETNNNIQSSSPPIDTNIDNTIHANSNSSVRDSEVDASHNEYMEAVAEYEAETLAHENKKLLIIVTLIALVFFLGLMFRLLPILSMRLLGLLIVGFFIYHVFIKLSTKTNQDKE